MTPRAQSKSEVASPYSPPQSVAGKIKPMVLLWALGVPIPIVLIIWGVKSCAT